MNERGEVVLREGDVIARGCVTGPGISGPLYVPEERWLWRVVLRAVLRVAHMSHALTNQESEYQELASKAAALAAPSAFTERG